MRVALRVATTIVAVAALVVLLTMPTGASASKLSAESRPPDPPIGVRIQTLSADPRAAIWIDGKPVRDTHDRNGIFVDVLEGSTTRTEVEPGTVPGTRPASRISVRIGGPLAQAEGLVESGYLMIVSGPLGVHLQTTSVPSRELFTRLGAPRLTAAQRRGVSRRGPPWSIIGIPGGPAGLGLGRGSGETAGLNAEGREISPATCNTAT